MHQIIIPYLYLYNKMCDEVHVEHAHSVCLPGYYRIYAYVCMYAYRIRDAFENLMEGNERI